MTALIALLLKIVGTLFLLVATLGVLRFPDPFQRMHAATKAGTLGAGLVLAGAAVAKGSLDATVIAVLTIVFLIATMPVAGHLLGRAAYISGARLRSRADALAGVLPRMAEPLEARLAGATAGAGSRTAAQLSPASGLAAAFSAFAGPPRPGAPKLASAPQVSGGLLDDAIAIPDPVPMPQSIPAGPGLLAEAGYDAVRFAVIGPDAGPLAARAWRLAIAGGVPATGVAVIDTVCLDSARIPAASDRIRARLANAVADTRRAIGNGAVPFTLVYEEGEPLDLIPGRDIGEREILLLPTDGWCHHGAQITLPIYEDRMADKLFTLAGRHPGPVLFAGAGTAGESRAVVIHDGSERTQELASWALRTGLWRLTEVTLIGRPTKAQSGALAEVAADCGLALTHLRKTNAPFSAYLPRLHAGVAAVVMSEPPQPARISAYGAFWQDRLIPGFRGDVLVA